MRSGPRHRLAFVLPIAGLASLMHFGVDARATDQVDSLIRRVVAQTTRTVSITARRELRAGTVSGKHKGWMTVETVMSAAGQFTWDVLEEGGSERTRNKVFRSLLETEEHTWREALGERSALTPANYEFLPLPHAAGEPVKIRLRPRRRESSLIDGTLTVSSDGYPMVLEGQMAKSPSFWVKSVTVVKRYERFAGVALPVTIESLADLRFFGQATFTMRYHYLEVNGRHVAHHVAVTPLTGPSPEILALHAASLRQ